METVCAAAQTALWLLCRGFAAVMGLYGMYFAAVSAGVLLRGKPQTPPERLLRFAVLVPARNEEACIAGMVESIRRQDYPPERAEVIVIPNHCTDGTAAAAERAGARVLEVSPAVRTKGAALREAVSRLLAEEGWDAVCVFDADNEADPGFLREMNAALTDARAAKSRIYAKNSRDGWVCGCYEVFFCTANRFLNTARQRLGLSARLIGTGFALRRDLLEELGGFPAVSMTEDAELFALLSARGERIAFAAGAVTCDEEPLTFRESLRQRRRWMSGIAETWRQQRRALLRGIRRQESRRPAFDAAVQLSFSWLQGWWLPVLAAQLLMEPEGVSALPGLALRGYGAALAMGLAALIWEGRLRRVSPGAAVLYPLFLLSFLPLQTLALLCPCRTWSPIRHTGAGREGTALPGETTVR